MRHAEQGHDNYHDVSLCNPSSNPTVVFYDMSANLTRVIESGDPLPNPVPGNYPYYYFTNGGRDYHTGTNRGFNYGHCASPPVPGQVCLVSRHWSDGLSAYEQDAVTVTWDGKKRKGKLQWVLIFVGTADTKTRQEHSGFWELIPWDPTGGNKFIVRNDGGMAVTIDRLGYQMGVAGPLDPNCQTQPTCDENEATLDSLNVGAFPPPGDKGSKFITLPIPPKKMRPGKSYKFSIE